ncbi:hypothetical protein IP78_09140 [Brevundimonas sp. AAP58]|uniref:hypothetical protein n=1 Tax=Brevundimonas sp. AAP58 TaxID=1523422 RepID=UPI0006B8BD7C|nr:hypothetical protein [Brevundimonas sp. AAP58]KPF79480.1 hypothetical protein IP78_09140 [Brevundimonas sp. AAP58]
MKRIGTAIFAAVMLVLAGCDPAEAPSPDRTSKAAGPPLEPKGDLASGETTGSESAGVPPFATVYPGGVISENAVSAVDAAGSGALFTYLTDATPDLVIAFHRQQAEAAGLESVMAMNQGEARAYGAASGQSTVQVVASPTADGRTSVQMSWSVAP